MMYEYWLASAVPLPDRKKRLLREAYGTGKAIYYIEEMQLRFLDFLTNEDAEAVLRARREKDVRAAWEQMKKKDVRFVPYFSGEYPDRLAHIADAPYALYVKGSLPEEDRPSVAIVGARKCTPYGESMALEYGERLAENGVQIVSGMAKGVDGAGQRGALNAGGTTYGVLGCGVDVCYPRDHMGLYKDIQARGGVLSEQPLGRPPLPMHFPARNRIISALSDVVLVMEARERSGSLITADMALEQGKDVYALPGPVTSRLSQGCHHLIRQGAGILISPEELMRELGICEKKPPQKSDKIQKMLENHENLVYSCLGLFPKGLDRLAAETGLGVRELFDVLVSLELKGYIREISKNYYARVR